MTCTFRGDLIDVQATLYLLALDSAHAMLLALLLRRMVLQLLSVLASHFTDSLSDSSREMLFVCIMDL